MRLSLKSSFALLAVYLLILGAVVFFMERRLRAVSDSALRQTAQLVGREIAAMLTGPALQRLLEFDPASNEKLIETVSELTEKSHVVTSLLVVNADGSVVAGDKDQVGRQVSLPQLVFEGNTRPRFVAPDELLAHGVSYLFVPLEREGQALGYLRLTLKSEGIAQMYRAARWQLLITGVAGLICVLAVSALLQLQFARTGVSLSQNLEAALRGESVRSKRAPDEFAQAFETARRVGQELTSAREKGSQAQRRFDSLMQVMDVGVLLLNPNQGLDFANRRARQLLECPSAEALERRWHELRSVLEPRLDSCGQHGSQGSQVDVEVPGETGAAPLRLELYQLSDDDCQGYLILVKSRDTIEVLENELRLAIQMRGLARFYMAFAHDLKAPLNAMAMNIELLRRTLGNGPAENGVHEQQEKYLKVLKSEVARLDRDLQTLLNEAALPRASAETFDLRELIQSLETFLTPQAKQQQVKLSTRLPQTAVAFSGHRDRLKQALLNIAINALEAMPRGGELTFELKADPQRARLWVSDTGPGIPPELLEEIYKMRFTTKDAGTGVGLYVARSVVEAHGGQIHVESTPGQGTRFELALPLPPTPV